LYPSRLISATWHFCLPPELQTWGHRPSLSRNLRPQKSLLKFLSLNLSDPTPPPPNHIPRGRPYFDLGTATTGSQRRSLPHSCVCLSTRKPGCPYAHETPNLPVFLATARRSLPQARLRTSHNHCVTRARFRTIRTARPILQGATILIAPGIHSTKAIDFGEYGGGLG